MTVRWKTFWIRVSTWLSSRSYLVKKCREARQKSTGLSDELTVNTRNLDRVTTVRDRLQAELSEVTQQHNMLQGQNQVMERQIEYLDGVIAT